MGTPFEVRIIYYKKINLSLLAKGENMLKEIYKFGELEILSKLKEKELETHPLHDLFWECTLTCNAKCKHCGSSAEKKRYDG